MNINIKKRIKEQLQQKAEIEINSILGNKDCDQLLREDIQLATTKLISWMEQFHYLKHLVTTSREFAKEDRALIDQNDGNNQGTFLLARAIMSEHLYQIAKAELN